MTESQSELIKTFKNSGQTQKEWCQANNVKIHNLRYWLSQERKQFESTSETPQWQALQVRDDNQPPLILKVANISIEVHPSFDPKHLLNVLQTLAAL